MLWYWWDFHSSWVKGCKETLSIHISIDGFLHCKEQLKLLALMKSLSSIFNFFFLERGSNWIFVGQMYLKIELGWARLVHGETTFKHRPAARFSYGRTSIIEPSWCFKCSNHRSFSIAYLQPSYIILIQIKPLVLILKLKLVLRREISKQ